MFIPLEEGFNEYFIIHITYNISKCSTSLMYKLPTHCTLTYTKLKQIMPRIKMY